MLHFFKSNDPYRLFAVALVALALYLPQFIDRAPLNKVELNAQVVGMKVADGFRPASELIDDTPPLAAWTFGLVHIISGEGRTFPRILAFLIILVQGVILGNMFINRKAFPESNYLPSLVFILVSFVSPDMLTLSEELLGSLFLMLGISYLLREVEFDSPQVEGTFNLGLALSFASLFHLPYVWFVVVTIPVLLVFSRRDSRMIFLLFAGFMLPHVSLLTYYFLLDSSQELVNNFYGSNLSFGKEWLVEMQDLLWLVSIPAVYLVVSMLAMGRESRFTKYQAQLMQIMFLWLLVGVVVLFWGGYFRPQRILHLAPCLSFFITHLFLLIRRKRLAEMLLWILFIGVVLSSYLSRYEKISDYVSVGRMWVREDSSFSPEGTKLLVLTGNRELLYGNHPSTGFINWQLCEPIIRQPDYYEHVVLVAKNFERDPPDVVVDPENLLKPFIDRIPALRKSYRREGDTYVHVNN